MHVILHDDIKLFRPYVQMLKGAGSQFLAVSEGVSPGIASPAGGRVYCCGQRQSGCMTQGRHRDRCRPPSVNEAVYQTGFGRGRDRGI
jgi:hypothetical protein